jgi:hypothetical protein
LNCRSSGGKQILLKDGTVVNEDNEMRDDLMLTGEAGLSDAGKEWVGSQLPCCGVGVKIKIAF